MIIIKDVPSLKAHLAKGRFNHNDILPFLSVMRIEIENKSQQEQMKWLNLFCNWSLHPQISSSMIVVDIMQSFLSSLSEWDLGDSDSIRRFNDTIIDSFRSDLAQLLHSIGIDNQFIAEDETFLPIFNYILNVIHKRPLVLPSESFLSQRASRRSRVDALRNAATSLYRKDCQIESLKLKANSQNQLSWLLSTTVFINIELPIGYGTKRFALND